MKGLDLNMNLQEQRGQKKNMLNYTTEVWWHTPDCGKVNKTEKQVSSKNKLQGKKKKKKR